MDGDGIDTGSESEEELEEEVPTEDEGKYAHELFKSYDELVRAPSLAEALKVVVAANPINSSALTVSDKVREFMHNQGKTRVVNTFSSGLLVASDVESDVEGDDSGEINERREREVKDLIWRFIKYLAERDLSKDSISNRRRKLRHIPALIIYLFSSKLYGLLINCPYLPEEYQVQVKNFLNKISERKLELVDELARMLEDAGSKELAAKVRDLGISFFDFEPAELRSSVVFRNIEIKNSDISIYKSLRNKYVSISKSITQESASDLIEVVVDKEAGISEKLKDKVRTMAILEVKELLRKFSQESSNEKDNEVAINLLLST